MKLQFSTAVCYWWCMWCKLLVSGSVLKQNVLNVMSYICSALQSVLHIVVSCGYHHTYPCYMLSKKWWEITLLHWKVSYSVIHYVKSSWEKSARSVSVSIKGMYLQKKTVGIHIWLPCSVLKSYHAYIHNIKYFCLPHTFPSCCLVVSTYTHAYMRACAHTHTDTYGHSHAFIRMRTQVK
jgi:hypothetical protein